MNLIVISEKKREFYLFIVKNKKKVQVKVIKEYSEKVVRIPRTENL